MSSHHQHGRPDGLGDALPQLGGGARLVEPPGELPRLGWSRRSHGTEHLSSEFQRTRPRRCDSEESRAPGNETPDDGFSDPQQPERNIQSLLRPVPSAELPSATGTPPSSPVITHRGSALETNFPQSHSERSSVVV
ncbi:unnamed protein product [Pleuronectes platessa]|uniref:Uncharacterized protein n=1 Tax=Pleuronectes platessa TaxID=8262 RepID=A0A9N7Z580_PLEPL|nr:unnamed protein product [Pleuronectes platessa]